MVIRAVVFDIGGVLEFNPRTGWQQRWADRLSIDRREFERRLRPSQPPVRSGKSVSGKSRPRSGRAFRLDAPAVTALMDELWEEYLGTFNGQLAEYFAALRPGYRTGILSNSFVGAREQEQALYRFDEMCDVIVYSHDQGSMNLILRSTWPCVSNSRSGPTPPCYSTTRRQTSTALVRSGCRRSDSRITSGRCGTSRRCSPSGTPRRIKLRAHTGMAAFGT